MASKCLYVYTIYTLKHFETLGTISYVDINNTESYCMCSFNPSKIAKTVFLTSHHRLQ